MTSAVIEVQKLIDMANQIGEFFAPYAPDQRAEGIRNHLRHYWDPRMREALLHHLDSGGEGLSPEVRAGATLLRDAERTAKQAYAGPPRPRPAA
jgi:formate dehydrogenase subunit delta